MGIPEYSYSANGPDAAALFFARVFAFLSVLVLVAVLVAVLVLVALG